jgi:hypothetical protein
VAEAEEEENEMSDHSDSDASDASDSAAEAEGKKKSLAKEEAFAVTLPTLEELVSRPAQSLLPPADSLRSSSTSPADSPLAPHPFYRLTTYAFCTIVSFSLIITAAANHT